MELLQTRRAKLFADIHHVVWLSAADAAEIPRERLWGVTSEVICSGVKRAGRHFSSAVARARPRLMIPKHFMTAISCDDSSDGTSPGMGRVTSLMYLFSCVAQRQPRRFANLIFIICKHFSSNVSSKQSVKLKSESFWVNFERDQGACTGEHPSKTLINGLPSIKKECSVLLTFKFFIPRWAFQPNLSNAAVYHLARRPWKHFRRSFWDIFTNIRRQTGRRSENRIPLIDWAE